MKSCPACKVIYPDDFSICPKDGAALARATEFAEGAVLRGKYEILAKLGAGGMGAVYKARHLHFHEICALKVVKSHLLEEPEFLQRFRSEAQVMRRLNHPNAVQVRDFDETEDGRPFMVMEFIEGRSLDEVMTLEAPLEPGRAARIAAQVCSALGAAHQLGIIHRDIKPSNVLLISSEEGEQAKVLDFGIAKVKEASSTLHKASLTGTGFVVGTPEYMSPEQAMGTRGDSLDGRTDLYSLGILLYEMLTGRLPFAGNTPVMMLVAHVQTQPPSPLTLRADLPPELARLVLRALEKNPDHRFPDADAMREELEAIAQELEPARTPTTATGQRPVTRAGVTPPPSMTPPPSRQASRTPPPPRVAAPPREIFRQPEPQHPSPLKYAAVGGVIVLAAIVGFLVVTGRLGFISPSPATESAPPEPQQQAPASQPAAVEPKPTAPAESAESEKEATVRALLREARAAFERGDRATAKRLFEEAQARSPNHPDVREARRNMRRLFAEER
ncbi:MAG TPA: protein kinase, partial [Candidatus Acidoferrales bacterium]